MKRNPGSRARARVDIQGSEFEADLASIRARVRSVADSILQPILDTVYEHAPVRAAKESEFSALLDKLKSGELCAMDLEVVLTGWRDAWQLYRRFEAMCECRRPGRRGIPVPEGRHCMPCGEFHLCNACWDKHAGCQQEAT